MKPENQQKPRIILTNEGKSSYSDGLLWVSIGELKEGNGIWLKLGERIAVLPPLPVSDAGASVNSSCVSANLSEKNSTTKTNHELIQWLRDNSSGAYRPSAEAADRLELALHLLRQITQDLPQKRDWLNPDLELAAKSLIALDRDPFCSAKQTNITLDPINAKERFHKGTEGFAMELPVERVIRPTSPKSN